MTPRAGLVTARGEAATRSAASAGSSALAAVSSGGEADELIGEVARSEVNEMGNAMATASNGGEASESTDESVREPRARTRGGLRGNRRRIMAGTKGK